MSSLSIHIADSAGACFGVDRALLMARGAANPEGGVHTLGPLIHNPRVVAELAEAGAPEAATLDEAGSGTIVIRSHGVAPQVIDEAQARGFEVVDATCPYVKKVHEHARRMASEGRTVVIVGEEGHAEVEGIRQWAGSDDVLVIDDPAKVPAELPDRVGIVAQTTQNEGRYDAVVAVVGSRCKDVEEHKTICRATSRRQLAAAQLASQCDAMVVVGGKMSGNTRRLAEVCSAHCPTFHIESADEIDQAWFAGMGDIGVTAGASTPQAHIAEVADVLRAMEA